MASTTRIPHLLNPYVRPPPQSSLILLTGILDASTNWLLLRLLLSFNARTVGDEIDGSLSGRAPRTVLVSCLRDWEFWRDGARRSGLDLAQSAKQGNFIYVDGLFELFGKNLSSEKDARLPPSAESLRDPSVQSIKESVVRILDGSERGFARRTTLLVDGLDFLLAATTVSSTEILDAVMEWRERADAVVITASADYPLLQSPSTPVEVDHSAFVSGLAQQAYFVLSLRLLSTGIAKDVSGVLRITRGPEAKDLEAADGEIAEKEFLYFVAGDGSVKVFERGAGE